MKFVIRKFLTNETYKHAIQIEEIELYFQRSLENKNFGRIKTFYLGFILSELENDTFFKERKTKINIGSKIINKSLKLFDEDFLSMEITFNLNNFKKLSFYERKAEIIRLISTKLIKLTDTDFFDKTLFFNEINKNL